MTRVNNWTVIGQVSWVYVMIQVLRWLIEKNVWNVKVQSYNNFKHVLTPVSHWVTEKFMNYDSIKF